MHNVHSDTLIPDKSEWGPGVWQTEPDLQTWTDDSTGLEVQVIRDAATGTLGYMVGVEEDHPAYELEGAAVPIAGPGIPETHEANGKWWFSFSFARDHDGQPARKHRVEHYRTLLEVQEHATRMALDIKRFGDAHKRGDAHALTGANAATGKGPEVSAAVTEPDDKQVTLDEVISAKASSATSPVIPDTPAPDATLSLDEAIAKHVEEAGPADALVAPPLEDEPTDSDATADDSGTATGSKRSRKKS